MQTLPNVRFLSEAISATCRIYEMTDRLPLLESTDQEGEIIENIQGKVEFINVEFTYPSRPEDPVLCGLNLCITAGQTIGLVGGSGSGKSTAVSLLQRFYSPDKGIILFDGNDVRMLHIEWLRSQMGLVSQEPVLFATSIKENILFGNEEASMEQIVTAARAANAHDFITKLPHGYDTHVSCLRSLTHKILSVIQCTIIMFRLVQTGWTIWVPDVRRAKAKNSHCKSID